MKFDVIIVGGSYAGLAAGMGLGRALRSVLLIDSGKPANRYTPHSHNFLTQDGKTPSEISALAGSQVDLYDTVKRIDGHVVKAEQLSGIFQVTLSDGSRYFSTKLIFATGIIDVFPGMPGFQECWGKTVLHCPYCHGYEVRDAKTGILGNGDYAFEFGSLISNWTSDLTIYTNGPATLTREQTERLNAHQIYVVENEIAFLEHKNGSVERIVFSDGQTAGVRAIYTRPEFKQHCVVPQALGCELTPEGYIKTDMTFRTTVPGVYACGDNTSRIRTVANAVAMGTTTAITVNRDLVTETF